MDLQNQIPRKKDRLHARAFHDHDPRSGHAGALVRSFFKSRLDGKCFAAYDSRSVRRRRDQHFFDDAVYARRIQRNRRGGENRRGRIPAQIFLHHDSALSAHSVICGGWGFRQQLVGFYGPLVYLRDSNSYTLAVAIYYDSITTNVAMESANVRMAAGVFMSIPPALLFLLYQRKLVDGIQMGAVKA